jgi:predicted DCC family thiol-disulfide oxidoreductase YuxK
MTHPAPVLLYDGTCGFCASSVRLVLRHDRRRVLRFAALDGPFGRQVRERHPELAGVDSVVWVDPPGEGRPERVLLRSDAALRVARYLGGPFHLARVAALLPRPVRDTAYALVARHRHRLTGGGPRCLVPPPEVRERFLDSVA